MMINEPRHIEALYKAFLGRSAGDTVNLGWEFGHSACEVISAIIGSPEFFNEIFMPIVKLGQLKYSVFEPFEWFDIIDVLTLLGVVQRSEERNIKVPDFIINADKEKIVRYIYWEILWRNPDVLAEIELSAKLNDNLTIEEFVNSIISSKEYINLSELSNNKRELITIYNNEEMTSENVSYIYLSYNFVLSRDPDNSGFYHHFSELEQNRTTRHSMFQSLITSTEASLIRHTRLEHNNYNWQKVIQEIFRSDMIKHFIYRYYPDYQESFYRSISIITIKSNVEISEKELKETDNKRPTLDNPLAMKIYNTLVG